MPNKHKLIKCAKCNRSIRQDTVPRHQKSRNCLKFNEGSSYCPFSNCSHHVTEPNLRRQIKNTINSSSKAIFGHDSMSNFKIFHFKKSIALFKQVCISGKAIFSRRWKTCSSCVNLDINQILI